MSIQTHTHKQICEEIAESGEVVVLFNTDFETTDNTETMDVFLEVFDVDEDDIKLSDGTYCEIFFNGVLCEVHASGNGTFSSHKIEIKKL